MKKKLLIVLLLSWGIQTNHVLAQDCLATFEIQRPQCDYVLENTSSDSYKFHWVINGKTYYTDKVDLVYGEFQFADICLYVEDTINHCADTMCKTIKGPEKLVINYYTYKQNLYVNVERKANSQASYTYVMDCGDKKFENSYGVGVLRHTYLNQGKYRVSINRFDSADKHCRVSVVDSITIGNSAQCHAYFVCYTDTSGYRDSTVIFNRAAGENLKYYWDLGDGTYSTMRFPTHVYSLAKKIRVCLTIIDSITNCSSGYCDSFDVKENQFLLTASKTYGKDVSIDALEFAKCVSIYPNPFIDKVQVNLPELDKEVYWVIMGLDGKVLREGSIGEWTTESTIDLEDLEKGLYMMVFRVDGITMVKKLVKD